jgi:hypothetical protein
MTPAAMRQTRPEEATVPLFMMRWIILSLLALAVAACSSRTREESTATAHDKGASPDETAAGTPGAGASANEASAAGPSLPVAVREYRDLFLPIWSFEPATGRSKRACDAFSALQKKANAIDGGSPPAGVAADEWSEAVESLGLCTESISEYCDDDDIGNEDMAARHIECAHKALERITALAPSGKGDTNMGKQLEGAQNAASADQTRAALSEFETAFLAAWKGAPDGRVKRACGAGLFKLAARIDKNAALPGVAAGKWRDAVTTLWQETEEFGANCDDTDDAVKHLAKTLLASIHDNLQELRKMLPR